jgi:hypothetical protein
MRLRHFGKAVKVSAGKGRTIGAKDSPAENTRRRQSDVRAIGDGHFKAARERTCFHDRCETVGQIRKSKSPIRLRARLQKVGHKPIKAQGQAMRIEEPDGAQLADEQRRFTATSQSPC